MGSYEERKLRGPVKARKREEELLGWEIGAWNCDYKVGMPGLSDEEKEVVAGLTEKFREATRHAAVEDKEDAKREMGRLLADYCEERGIGIEQRQADYLVRTAVAHTYGFSALDELLMDDELEELAVVGIGKPIFIYHRARGWLKTNCAFRNGEALIDVMNKMARGVGRRITLQSPRLNAVLPDGSRMHASIPPISEYELTIRKFRRNPIHVADLIAYKTFSPGSLAFLWMLMQADASLVIAGNTASGKTSTLNALFQFISLKERVLITEETPEINVPHEHKVKLLSSAELGIPMKELVADSLRMRPDRVIVGEARTAEEVGALLETMTSGQARGSYATFHAQSAREVLVRMRSLGALPNDLQSLDLIVVQRRLMRYDPKARKGHEVRRCTEISEIVPPVSAADDAKLPALRMIFKYDAFKDAVVAAEKSKILAGRVCESFGISRKEFDAELQRRAEFLAGLDVSRSFDEITREVQRFSFADFEEETPKAAAAPAGVAFFNSVFE
ncbi:MAG: ATPase, T2SS/T4P/T4SS family [Candidatus Burarchaeum sp.]|nr:ATPase, T2SS/T4P/T4SS family [Candidatus Burarchaeum sp.]MDO8340103.1 ATPase, T2SS/T4P/T4SS family [Candidatus Burarchaeum sp.]